MILVDTCVWIDHLRATDDVLVELLEASGVCTHPMVIGELALGGLKARADVLRLLHALPTVMPATHDEVLLHVEREALFGRGLSLVDAHLLASARISPGVAIWTRDKGLRAAAVQLGLAAELDRGSPTTR